MIHFVALDVHRKTVRACVRDETGKIISEHDLPATRGLVPSTHQSGEHCYHGHITRCGNGKARWMLARAAQHAAAHPGTGKRTRTELALQTVYEQGQMPAATSYERLKSAERRMLKQNDIDNFAQAIQRPQTTERIRSRTTKPDARSQPRSEQASRIDRRDMGRLADAEREFRSAVQLQPTFVPSWLGIVEICKATRRFSDAEGVMQQVRAIESGLPVR